jgi:uncharacterized SAM-binding protein YcdF (DUF218 family)
MFFYLSKVLWFFATPSNALASLVATGLLAMAFGWRRLGLAAGATGMALLFLIGFGPLGLWALLPLEDRFPQYRNDGRPVAGIIVLGGGVNSWITAARGRLSTGEAGERILALEDLARRYPEAKLVYSGGSGALIESGDVPEADLVRQHAETLGIPAARIIAESRSRTTWENAVETRRLVTPGAGERWLLVTSAWHMPRAVGCFRQVGLDVTPYPVDYLTRGWNDALVLNGAIPTGLERFDLAIREWIGLAGYRLSGRSDALLPATASSSAASLIR